MSENLINLVKIMQEIEKIKMKINLIPLHYCLVDCLKCIDKMEEEFGELKEALNDNSNIVHEAADTIYHLLVI